MTHLYTTPGPIPLLRLFFFSAYNMVKFSSFVPGFVRSSCPKCSLLVRLLLKSKGGRKLKLEQRKERKEVKEESEWEQMGYTSGSPTLLLFLHLSIACHILS